MRRIRSSACLLYLAGLLDPRLYDFGRFAFVVVRQLLVFYAGDLNEHVYPVEERAADAFLVS